MIAQVLRRRRRLQRLDVVEGDVAEAGRQRREGLAVARRAAGRDRREGAAVEAIDGGDDLRGAVLLLAAPLVRQLDRRLVRLGAGVGEVDAVEDGVVDQELGKLELGHRVHGVRDVDQRPRLLLDRLDDDRVAVAEAVHRGTAEEVEVGLVVVVPDAGAFTADEDDGHTTPGRHEYAALQLSPIRHLSGLLDMGQQAGKQSAIVAQTEEREQGRCAASRELRAAGREMG